MKKIIFCLITFFLLITPTKALTLTCPTTASIGDEVNCSLTDEEYIGIKAKYNIDSPLKYSYINTNSSWKKYYATETGFSIGNVKNQDKLTLNLNLKIPKEAVIGSNYKVELTNIEVTTKDYKYQKLNNISSTIKIVSNDNTLKQLEVVGHELSPKFNSNTLDYKVSTTNDTITIKATPTDNSATISGDIGEKKLQYGVNKFTINVTSAKGEVRKYNLYITRNTKSLPKSSDITLKSLTIKPGKIAFDKNNFQYKVDIEYNIENIEVTAVPTSDKADIKIEQPEKLEIGENIISIIVTAEDGTTGKYIIVVNKLEKPSSEATIKNITIKGYTLDFKSDIYKYELEIEDDNKLDIEVELNDDKAKYQILGNNNLKNNSIITIQVEDEDGTIKNYKIKVLKLVETNSSSIFEKINLVSLVGFIVLVSIILGIKTIYNKKVKTI